MRRSSRLVALSAAGLLAISFTGTAAAAPTACGGAGYIYPTSAINSRVASDITFIDFDFAGVHPLCLADGTQVQGVVAGHVWQRLYPDGSLFVRFAERLSLNGASLHYAGNATLNSAGWHSHVRTVGAGTGALAGIHGQGAFSPIDPVTGAFTDEIHYVYR
jgi:hypothetical protein